MSRTESPLSSIKKWGCVAPESNVKSVSSLAPSQRPRIGKKCDASPELKIIKKWNIKIIREPRPVEKNFEKKLKYIFWSQQGKTKKTIIVSELEWINFEKIVTFEKYSIFRKLANFWVPKYQFWYFESIFSISKPVYAGVSLHFSFKIRIFRKFASLWKSSVFEQKLGISTAIDYGP